jgi:GPH family glycoside/pentoside/hexuronide:cation symporter
MFEQKVLDSRIKSEKPTRKEQVLGYFFGPGGMAALNLILASFINKFYTDVLDLSSVWSGAFLVVLPIVSKFISILVNIGFGKILDKTKTRQGKARPWILVSVPVAAIAAVLVFIIPHMSQTGMIIWIFFSYNLYFSLSANIYNMSHALMVPLSTADVKERNLLSIITNIGNYLATGVLSIGIFSILVYPLIKTKADLWLPVVACFALLALILSFLEYFFTLERNTQESKEISSESFGEQVKALFHDKYWVMIAFLTLIYAFGTEVRSVSLMYYCEWTLGTFETAQKYYALIVMVGGLPLWIGALIIHPLVNKTGKRILVYLGLIITALGDFIIYFFMKNPYAVVTGAFIRNVGLIPFCYIFPSMLADVLDHIAITHGKREDGAAIGADNIIKTIFSGLGTGFFNLMLSLNGYVAPDPAKEIQDTQNASMQNWFGIMFSLIPGCLALVMAAIAYFFDVEKHIQRPDKKPAQIQ